MNGLPFERAAGLEGESSELELNFKSASERARVRALKEEEPPSEATGRRELVPALLRTIIRSASAHRLSAIELINCCLSGARVALLS